MRILYCIVLSVVCYLNVRFSRLIASVGEERAVVYGLLVILLFLFEGVSFSFGAWERLRLIFVTLPVPSIYIYLNCFARSF